ncbi:MAG: N-acetylmuramoyl-L-alanine amidase [Deltaproteobacteria bacterium]|nr:N-acetylmuramoyl-L-alanine amidase [Deltaproteobacteria bacterium]
MLLVALIPGCLDPRLQQHAGEDPPEAFVFGSRIDQQFDLVGDHYVSEWLEAADRASRVGLMIEMAPGYEEAAIAVEARGLDEDGRALSWVAATTTWAEQGLRVANADLESVAVAAQIRIPVEQAVRFRSIVWSPFIPVGATEEEWSPGAFGAGEPATLDQALDSSLSAGGVLSRSAWGARATRCTSLNTTKTKIAVHHTVTPTTYNGSYEARLRQIQAYHMDSRGYCDVGYHFFATADGRMWEAREAKYLGAHVLNNNTNTAGVTFVGCFHSSDCSSMQPNNPPEVMINGGGKLIGLVARRYGIAVSSSTVMGHRDFPGQSTACPGSFLYARMADLRSIAINGSTTTEPAPTKGTIKGVVWDKSVTAGPSDTGNVRITNATVKLSSGAQTTVRAEDAYWYFEIAAGTYTVTATAPEYQQVSREVQVTAGNDVWASLGMTPAPQTSDVKVTVFDATIGNTAPIAGASVNVTGQQAKLTDDQGMATFTVPAGSITISVTKEGFEPSEETRQATAGVSLMVDVGLTPLPQTEEPDPEVSEKPHLELQPGEIPFLEPFGENRRENDQAGTEPETWQIGEEYWGFSCSAATASQDGTGAAWFVGVALGLLFGCRARKG